MLFVLFYDMLKDAVLEEEMLEERTPMFRERITRHYQSLSPSFKRIADFILAAHDRAAFMSASRLARHVGVDVATVTRFSQQLGYDGYVQLIHEIQDLVLQEIRERRAPIQERLQSADGLVAQTLWRDWANLEKTIQSLRLDQAQEAARMLSMARRIYLVSDGVGAGLAMVAQSYLNMIRSGVVVLDHGPFDIAMELKEVGAEDVVVAIGFTNYAFMATRALTLAKKAGAKTIGIIAQADCPIGGEADLLLACSATEGGYLPSPTAIGAILFALVYSLYMSDLESYSHKLLEFQEAYSELTNDIGKGETDVIPDLMGLF